MQKLGNWRDNYKKLKPKKFDYHPNCHQNYHHKKILGLSIGIYYDYINNKKKNLMQTSGHIPVPFVDTHKESNPS
jgi:hypothetical protein